MNEQPTPAQVAILESTGEVAVFCESIDRYLKNKDVIRERLATLKADEVDALKQGKLIKL